MTLLFVYTKIRTRPNRNKKHKKEAIKMSKENKNDGVNRCRRCNRPLKDPTDAYGWWCAQIVGLDNYKKADETLDDDVLPLYNDYVSNHLAEDKTDNADNFTIKGENYKSAFIREKPDDPKKVKYTVISDVKVWGENHQAEYTIEDGVVRFKFEDNDLESVLWKDGGKNLSDAIYDAAKALSPDNLSGRTRDGIKTELQLHWAAYKLGIKKENARVADIGGINEPGQDSNAWFFEMVDIGLDIVDPKPMKDLVKDIWEYLK